MKNLVLTALALAACVYVEKKYNVCDKVSEQIKKYTDNNQSDELDDVEPIEEEG